MTGREFAEWMAYEQVAGTLGPERNDQLNAMLMALLQNMWRGKKSKARKVQAFLPQWGKRRKQSAEEMERAWRAFMSRFEGGD